MIALAAILSGGRLASQYFQKAAALAPGGGGAGAAGNASESTCQMIASTIASTTQATKRIQKPA